MNEYESNITENIEEPLVVDVSGISVGTDEREDLSGFQRIAAGFFAQTYEPALTINESKIGVNAAARLFPDVDYMEILINTEKSSVQAVRCSEYLWLQMGENQGWKAICNPEDRETVCAVYMRDYGLGSVQSVSYPREKAALRNGRGNSAL